MKKTTKEKDSWGQDVIYVEECDLYEYEEPDIPKNLQKLCKYNDTKMRLYDILEIVENYFENSGK